MRAITFDLWDTLVVDDSDEPRRSAAGLPSKVNARRALFVDAVAAARPSLSHAAAEHAWDATTNWFRDVWHGEHRTPTLDQRLSHAFARLDLPPPPAGSDLRHALAHMEVDYPPDLCPGAVETLSELAATYTLAIVSDAIVTPGAGLRAILAHHGLLEHFVATIFSDEAGASKPDPAVFHQAAAALGVSTSDLLHIGDRESTDVDGILGVGGTAVLYTGAVDRGSDRTRAHAICRNLADLPDVVARLVESAP